MFVLPGVQLLFSFSSPDELTLSSLVPKIVAELHHTYTLLPSNQPKPIAPKTSKRLDSHTTIQSILINKGYHGLAESGALTPTHSFPRNIQDKSFINLHLFVIFFPFEFESVGVFLRSHHFGPVECSCVWISRQNLFPSRE